MISKRQEEVKELNRKLEELLLKGLKILRGEPQK
jgi:hypothetical protein